ncbi:DUF4139 domain-containing protein [Azospirillum sp. RWY-5-1]|uniref:DUF4139 domain-containing protein n=1 Tax=Azospirillum oleiclasticum TaxID=2735135 RepID=A0ABX2TJW4_9PROT|nr:DUF4139 domain-containing protein [Azospirillum oleiclasticum]NYZ16838.1 DUF4139 domain-containing protein [Azospirillum oleiclasticum]NYZ24429.1 DUF4139 domain-containing protein [Azospirillum oleiclasticum]
MPRRILLLTPALLLALPADALAADGLVLKRVMLSTGGVAYFEHEATVGGDAALTLDVRRDQVDDVLKSVVVYDDQGGVGTISLPGEEPLEAVFRELPFTADDLASPVALLGALKGAEVRATGAREITGRLLSVTEEAAALPDGRGMVTRHRVALMTADGVRQLLLEEADALRFTDPRIQGQVDRALAAMAEHGGKARRTLTIRSTGGTAGQEERRVRVGYVAAAPLWKATYRLTLPQAGDGKGELQGWAVLENVSGEDWNGVELTVVSGNPVTFRQDLYSAYFVDRPTVPVEVLGRVLPRADEGSIAAFDSAAKERAAAPAGMAPPAAAAPPPSPMARGLALAPQRPAEPVAAESAEATTQVVFRYPQPVTLANGGSLMMPIVARAVPAERLALYQPGTQPRHPLAAVRLANDGGTGLPPGVLTLYERGTEGGPQGGAVSFVGDARLSTLPAGGSRLLSFAVDQKVTIDRAERPSQALARATVADGVMTLTVIERQTTSYSIAGAAREDRSVIIEHPRRAGWELVQPTGPKPEVTAGTYRIPVAVPAGGTASLTVTVERPRAERVGLADLNPDQLQVYAASTELPQPVRDAMAKLASLRAVMADKERRVAELERDRTTVTQDQERLRQNLGSLPRDSDLHKRTLARMGEAETRLDRVASDLATARREVEEARNALLAQVRGLTL